LIDAGYAGDGAPPELADEVWEATSSRYIDAFERITATPFRPGSYPVAERLQRWYRNAR
jgi:phosphoribosylaminoimidazole-succinocarboxamide synthase